MYTTTDIAIDPYFTYGADTTTIAILLSAMIMVMLFVGIGFYVLNAIFMMQLFKKAKVARWKAWVPIVNKWTFLQIGGQNGWWVLIGIVGVIASYLFFILAGVSGFSIGLSSVRGGAMMGGFGSLGYLTMFASAVVVTVFDLLSAHNIGKKLSWSGSMIVIYIFFPTIWLGMAGLSKAKFDDKKGQRNLAKIVK